MNVVFSCLINAGLVIVILRVMIDCVWHGLLMGNRSEVFVDVTCHAEPVNSEN